MIRSVKLSTKSGNINKKDSLESFQRIYSNTVLKIINHIWEFGYTNKNKTKFNANKKEFNLDSNLDNNFLKQFDNNHFTQRMLQACGTQASSIICSCTIKNKQRKHTMKTLMKEGRNASKLQSIYDKSNIAKPEFSLLQPQIDSRFFDIKESDNYNLFIQLRLFKNQNPIRIPLNKHKKMIQFENEGTILNSIRLTKDYVSFSYELPDKEKRIEGIKLGADQGITTCLTLSDGQTTKINNHGYDLSKIMTILSRRKKGSKGFAEAQAHRENYINWSLNQLNLSNVKQINLEKLFQIRKGESKGRFLSSFTYTLIKKKLESLSETEGFEITEIANQFRSQRCSDCGWTQKSSRRGKLFKCKHCGFATDADLNASINLEEDRLPPVPKWVREEKVNRNGFFWNLSGLFDSSGESIVPHVQKTHIWKNFLYNE